MNLTARAYQKGGKMTVKKSCLWGLLLILLCVYCQMNNTDIDDITPTLTNLVGEYLGQLHCKINLLKFILIVS